MHRVLNYGSALQAYALQHAINRMGISCELIDYVFPNMIQAKTLKAKIKSFIGQLITGFPLSQKKRKFNNFYDKYYKLSKHKYNTQYELETANLKYNFYITGSDQVWNHIHIKHDTSFFLPFVTNGIPKISYAASFSGDTINNKYRDIYAELLQKYNCISTREQSGTDIIKECTGKHAFYVCDPTLLLDKNEWHIAMANTQIKTIRRPYILVYIVRYAYDPGNNIYTIINDIQRLLGLHVIIIDGSIKDRLLRDTTVKCNTGPLEFLELVRNASFVITTSYHGTLFALNFEIPFYAIIKSRDGSDSRITSILNTLGIPQRAIIYDDNKKEYVLHMDYGPIRSKIKKFRKYSLNYLHSSINAQIDEQKEITIS